MTRRDLERRYADTRHWPLPPKDIPGGTCACGAVYMDNDAGRDAHELVMGHRPYSSRDPTGTDQPDTGRDDEVE